MPRKTNTVVVDGGDAVAPGDAVPLGEAVGVALVGVAALVVDGDGAGPLLEVQPASASAAVAVRTAPWRTLIALPFRVPAGGNRGRIVSLAGRVRRGRREWARFGG
ncbi:MAG: hypothetical protein GX427_06580 [Actinomycetales bacterium]|nr:hypothetical protein [Actinomycetales bacterium]